MIVKNESAVLDRCLGSICSAVDEIIIADTGSTDSTKEIASRYTDFIFDFKWKDDFSAARNFSFSKATKEYIMWLDADDILPENELENFKALKKSLDESTDIVMMPYHTAFDEQGNPVFSYYRERIVRKSLPHKWQGRVHETISCSGNRLFSAVPIAHKSVKTSYSKRNLNIYEKQKEEGEAFSPRDKFYYGRELYYHKYYDKANSVLNAFLESEAGWVEDNIEACKILAYSYFEKGDIKSAMHSLFKSFAFDSPRAEICCELGRIFITLQNYKTAAFWYELALNLPERDSQNGFVSKDCSGYIPAIQLCVCFDKLGDYIKAEKYNTLAGKFRPLSPAYLHNKEYFDSRFSHL